MKRISALETVSNSILEIVRNFAAKPNCGFFKPKDFPSFKLPINTFQEFMAFDVATDSSENKKYLVILCNILICFF